MRMRLAWLSNSRPDCLFEISQIAHVTESMFEGSKKQVIKRLNKAVKYAINNQLSLKIRRLETKSLRIIGFSDASFANNADLSSQLGYIIFLGDRHDNVVPICFKSYKARRVTRSVMAGEVICFSDLFDAAAALSQDLAILLRKQVPVQLLTDSKSLFDGISKGSRTSEKRTMLRASKKRSFRTSVLLGVRTI